MTASSSFVLFVATFLSVPSLQAQIPPGKIQELLPPDAKVIETADLNRIAGKQRTLVLWMRSPNEELRKPGPGYCGDDVYGDNWVGPTRLSVVDSANQTIVNTVEIVGPAFLRDDTDSFRLPFFVPNVYYKVPKPDSKREGVPTILDLRDLTGDGVPAEFVLFMYGACGIVSTSVFGYSQKTDRAVQYAVEVSDGKQPVETEFWIDQVFAIKPVRPGQWDFTWGPGHGSEDMVHDQVSFNRVRQVFVDKQTVTSYPGAVRPK